MQQKLPNSTTVLILGIVSIISCCCYGVIGIITGVVALVLYKKDAQLYRQHPEQYTGFDVLKAGRILAIIGIVLSVLYIVYILVIFSIIGWDALNNPQLIQERIRDLMEH